MNSSPRASVPQTSEQEPSAFDVAFVGTGISNTFTLIEFLSRLERHPTAARILLIDKDPEFFTGIAYGSRSGDLGLIISRLADFLPESHARGFGDWLAGHRDQAFERFFAMGGDYAENWRRRFWPDVEAGELAELFVPRYIFGLYFAHLARIAIDHAAERGLASCESVVAEVVDIERSDQGFAVATLDSRGRDTVYSADRVVLGLGSAPSRRLLEPEGEAPWSAQGAAMIDDPFEPGIADMVQRIRTAADRERGARGRVVVIGSNAGALDVIFNLMNDTVISAAISGIDVLSMSGAFPELFSPPASGARTVFVCRALDELATRETIRADDIFIAVTQDIENARQDGLTINDTFLDIAVGFNALLDRLSPDEKQRFASDTGPRIGALHRKAGQDYWELVTGLMRAGTLQIHARRFVPGADADAALRADDLLAVVNCSGSERLSSPRLHSALLRTLVERKWVHPTDSGLGIRVNGDLETETPGLYVIGPMLTGNVVNGDPTWNLEHCGRIANFARRLADHLVDRALTGAPR